MAGGTSHVVVGEFSHPVARGIIDESHERNCFFFLFFKRGISDGNHKNSEVVDFRMVTCKLQSFSGQFLFGKYKFSWDQVIGRLEG